MVWRWDLARTNIGHLAMGGMCAKNMRGGNELTVIIDLNNNQNEN